MVLIAPYEGLSAAYLRSIAENMLILPSERPQVPNTPAVRLSGTDVGSPAHAHARTQNNNNNITRAEEDIRMNDARLA